MVSLLTNGFPGRSRRAQIHVWREIGHGLVSAQLLQRISQKLLKFEILRLCYTGKRFLRGSRNPHDSYRCGNIASILEINGSKDWF